MRADKQTVNGLMCEEKPRGVAFALELSKPFSIILIVKLFLLGAGQISFATILMHVSVFLLFSIVVWFAFSKFLIYRICDNKLQIVRRALPHLKLKSRTLMARDFSTLETIRIDQVGKFYCNVVAFDTRLSGGTVRLEKRRGYWLLFLSMPVRFGFYGLEANGAIAASFADRTGGL